ncbi:MAG TPA: galactose-1-phosphate uridylyltransferase [Fimbriimonadaceae bacterium]|nr:galactose-1-phosphate uridylyltransferase [Fimbriimonadaceae bacterium]
MSELRYHPFLDQWVITATQRQDRTFLPPDDYCPLCPTKPGGFPTEVPYPDYDIVVFENKFPSLRREPPASAVEGTDLLPVRPSHGVCEVVSYSDQHDATFATMPYSQIRKLTRVWRDRYMSLGALDFVEYVFIFENKGKEIGVTLSHPHGQIYAYPFIPPTLKIELASEKRHLDRTGRLLMEDWLAFESSAGEMEKGDRIVWQNGSFVAIVPFFARYPYEVYVTSKRHIRSIAVMTPEEMDDLAEILLVVTRKYDLLFGFSLPYMMVMHQEPAVPGYDFNWFHVEFYPPYRTAKKLKYLAGSEAGAAAFINDTLPEETAKTLRNLETGGVRR